MINTPATSRIRVGLFALPVFGVLTLWATISAQPDAGVDPEGWALFVSSPSYLAGHVQHRGTILAMLGTIALGAFLASSRSPRLGLAAMVIATLGQTLLLAGGGLHLRSPGDGTGLP